MQGPENLTTRLFGNKERGTMLKQVSSFKGMKKFTKQEQYLVTLFRCHGLYCRLAFDE